MFAGDIVSVNPNNLNSSLEFLTAIVTPTLLIGAVGSLVLSTSTRLGRVVDRVRDLEKRLGELIYVEDKSEVPLYDKRVEVIIDLLDKVTSRARILQRCMVTFYMSLGMFVATSVAIGIVPFTGNPRYNMIPVVLGLAGACFLFYGSVLLILEARLALSTIHGEMDFIWQQTKRATPAEIVDQHKPHFVHFRRHE